MNKRDIYFFFLMKLKAFRDPSTVDVDESEKKQFFLTERKIMSGRLIQTNAKEN